MLASRNGHLETVKILLDADADTDLKTPEGDSALKWAKQGRHQKIVDLLIKAEAEE